MKLLIIKQTLIKTVLLLFITTLSGCYFYTPCPLGSTLKQAVDGQTIEIFCESTDKENVPVRHGSYKKYFDKSKKQIATEGNYQFGTPSGKWKHYYPSGKLQSISTLKSDGEIESMTTFSQEGNKVLEINAEEAKTVTSLYWPNTKLRARVELDSHLSGRMERFYSNGRLEFLAEIENNQINGKYLSFYSDGSEKAVGKFHKNLPDGTWIVVNREKDQKWSYVYSKPGVRKTVTITDSSGYSFEYQYNQKDHLIALKGLRPDQHSMLEAKCDGLGNVTKAFAVLDSEKIHADELNLSRSNLCIDTVPNSPPIGTHPATYLQIQNGGK